MMFTDYYGEQSCTAGRAAFITGQSVFRSGLSKVGVPGATLLLLFGSMFFELVLDSIAGEPRGDDRVKAVAKDADDFRRHDVVQE
jgi:hypothetical protein